MNALRDHGVTQIFDQYENVCLCKLKKRGNVSWPSLEMDCADRWHSFCQFISLFTNNKHTQIILLHSDMNE